MRWREVVYDIFQSLKQSFDDSEITLNHAKYWCTIMANRLLAQHIEKRDSGGYLTVFNDVNVSKDEINGYKYVDLPKNILDFNLDAAINYISYGYCLDDCNPPFTSVLFTRTTPTEARVLYYTAEEKPSPSNPYFYRVGNRVYLLGIECVNTCPLEMGLYTTIDFDECDMDDEFNFPEELLPILQRYVFDIGRFVLSIPNTIGVNDGTNDGVEGNEVPKTKLINVNDLQQPMQQVEQ
jgi:hypothetical protein